jgi:hypothetical protein
MGVEYPTILFTNGLNNNMNMQMYDFLSNPVPYKIGTFLNLGSDKGYINGVGVIILI